MIDPDTTTRINAVTVKMKDSKTQETIVYIYGETWCGSGGCTMLILEPTGSSFKELGWVSIVQLPIVVLPSMHNGHPDIGVGVRGGGILPGYEALLRFDGKSYPGNPSVPPARKVTGIKGEVVVSPSDDGVPLYE